MRGRPAAIVLSPVLAALRELRHAKPHEVAARLGGRFTVKQVNRALTNAKTKKLVDSTGVTRIKGLKGSAPAVYWLAGTEPPPQDEGASHADLFKPNRYYPKRPRYASVWHYAQGIAANDTARRSA